MSVLGNIKSPEGHTAWDYAQTVITLLHGLREDIQADRGDEPTYRRLPFAGITDATTGLLTLTYDLPRGKRWEIAGYGVEFGVNTGNVAFYVNEVSGTNLIWGQPTDGINTRIAGNFGDLGPAVTEDDVKLIVVVTAGVSLPISGNVRIRQFDKNPSSPKRAVG